MRFPKVLIFGQPFNRNTGGGITLSNLFQGWDKDCIAVIGTGHMLRNLNTEICDCYYQIGSDENKWVFPLNQFQKKFTSGVINIDKNYLKTQTVQQGPNIYQKPNFRQKLVDYLMYPLLKYFGIFHSLSSIQLTRKLCRWLEDYNPDILYVQVQARDEVLFVKKLHSFLKKPMVVHMMDDWPSYISSTGLFKHYWQKKIDREFRILINQADLLMSISDEMAKEYKSRYGKNFITFHNPVDIVFWKQSQRTNYNLEISPIVLYAGRMGVGIESSLKLISEAILKVNKELNISIKFVLQTQEKLSWFDKYNCVKHDSFVEYNDLPKRFSEADFLILPYDFLQKSIRYIKYSMPTKVSEYMVSGTPIIVFAPEETAMVKYAQEFEWAKVITENDIDILSRGIKQLVENKEAREQIAQNAINIAEKNHNAIHVTNQFKSLIYSLVVDEYVD
ncbi:glycosyltransferase [bacterium]|nr:MAG: glycosyltransferase [bacterium]